MTMRDDFLTIPDAPDYEINSQLICRQKKTGYILKKSFDRSGNCYYSVHCADGKWVQRTPQRYRQNAVAAVTPGTFEPIPSLNYRYEIDTNGRVRNAKTKRILKPVSNGKVYPFSNGSDKCIYRATADLLWEVHGRISKNPSQTVPCFAENERGKHYFPNLKACARFLAPKVHYCLGWIYQKLHRREEYIFGWKITYLGDKPVNNRRVMCQLGAEARLQQSAEEFLKNENNNRHFT